VRFQGATKSKDGKTKAKEKVFGPVTVLDARSGKVRVLNTTVNFREDATFVEATPQTASPSAK
jgi:hypothetical protein